LTNRSRLLSVGALCLILLFVGCPRTGAALLASPVEISTKFVELYVSGQLTVEESKRLVGDDGVAERVGDFWQIRSADRRVIVLIGPRESNDEAELRLDRAADVKLADLEKAFGRWTLVAAGETSSVVFDVGERVDHRILVFVRLLTSRPSPESAVLSLQPRSAPRQ
jgi:hypothetical protein